MKHVILTVLLLLAAMGCYIAGYELNAFALLAAGGALELWFWVRALRSGSKPPAVAQRP